MYYGVGNTRYRIIRRPVNSIAVNKQTLYRCTIYKRVDTFLDQRYDCLFTVSNLAQSADISIASHDSLNKISKLILTQNVYKLYKIEPFNVS